MKGFEILNELTVTDAPDFDFAGAAGYADANGEELAIGREANGVHAVRKGGLAVGGGDDALEFPGGCDRPVVCMIESTGGQDVRILERKARCDVGNGKAF